MGVKMNDIFSFLLLIGFIVMQRIFELRLAQRNEKWMKKRGAIEFGEKHYRYMVIMHLLFFIFLCGEKIFINLRLSPLWGFLFILFLCAQLFRIWVITSLGRFWNTKIIVLRNANVVRKGPYRFIKHPNYFVVAVELAVVPLMFNAYYTASLFTLLNIIMMMIRIPEEEKALRELTEYAGEFKDCNRFLPRVVK
jgi:methyltransferase